MERKMTLAEREQLAREIHAAINKSNQIAENRSIEGFDENYIGRVVGIESDEITNRPIDRKSKANKYEERRSRCNVFIKSMKWYIINEVLFINSNREVLDGIITDLVHGKITTGQMDLFIRRVDSKRNNM